MITATTKFATIPGMSSMPGTNRMPEATPTEQDPRWRAIVGRDRGADDVFFYSVETTGVYCRPSCGARRPRPEHVRFHETAADAGRAGFRPCRRCRPELPTLEKRRAALVAAACQRIAAAEAGPSLTALAESAGLSPHHFHRLFKSVTGVTPKAYADAHRAARVRTELKARDTVTEAIYQSGFNSGGRFYAASARILGMSPSDYRAGAPRTEIMFAAGQCSLGAIVVAASLKGVCAILLGDDPDTLVADLQERFPQATFVGGDQRFERLVARVVGLVEAPALGHELPLDVQGTAFQERVWQALRDVPAGSTISYAGLAARIGAPGSARAVAQACAANRVAVAIPCHRVVRREGALSGYRWGVERKRELLARESAERAGGPTRG